MAVSYQEFEKYRELIDTIKDNRCILFVGAGLSVKAGYPTWKQLMEKAIDHLRRDSTEEEIAALNQWIGQGAFLSIAAYFREKIGDYRYAQFIKESFIKEDIAPTEEHSLIVELPFSCIITTNYDKLIETAYTRSKHAVIPTIKYYDSSDLGSLNFDRHFYILKCHGNIDEPNSLILTEEQYQALIYKNEPYKKFMETLLATKIFLYIGYSMHDPDLNLILSYFKNTFPDQIPPSYLLTTGLNPLEIDREERSKNIQIITFDNINHDFREVTEFLKILSREVTGKIPLSSPHITDSPADHSLQRNPFKFLDCYYKQDREWFYGREDDPALDNLLESLTDTGNGRTDRFYHVFGRRGIGKSSAIQAFIIPRLEDLGIACNHINSPLSLHDLARETLQSDARQNGAHRSILFIDHFEKILEQYNRREEIQEGVETWISRLIDNVSSDEKIVFITTQNENSIYLDMTFNRTGTNINIKDIQPLTGRALKTAITKSVEHLQEHYEEEGQFNNQLVDTLVEEYDHLGTADYALTYIQAVCYYLVKKGLYHDPEGYQKLSNRERLREMILEHSVCDIIKNLYHKDDRIILIEVLKRMFEEDQVDFDTIRKDLKNLFIKRIEFPEQVES